MYAAAGEEGLREAEPEQRQFMYIPCQLVLLEENVEKLSYSL